MKYVARVMMLFGLISFWGCGVSGTDGSSSADGYEQDDTPSQAKSISVGSPQNRNFVDDSSDWVSFSAIAGYSYTIETSNLGVNEDTILYLFDSSGTHLYDFDDDGGTGYASKIVWTASSSGTFKILVASWETPLNTTGREYTLTVSAQAPTPKPDLSMGSMTVPGTAAVNGVISITDTVNNTGTADAGSFYVDYYISTNSTISTGDTYIGSRQISSLASSASDTASSDFAMPGGLSVGTYYIGALVDGSDTIVESDETNNGSSAYGINVTAANPSDLTISGVSTVSSVNAGNSISVVDTVSNNVATSNGIYVYYYLSTDATIDATDTYLGSRSITSLGVGASDTSSGVSLAIPRDMATGSYYIGAIVDPNNTVSETDETNNVSNAVSLTVNAAVPSDLTFSAFSPDTNVAYYDQINVTDTITNQGSGDEASFTVSYYISTDSVVDTSDSYLGSRTISSLAAGASDTATRTLSQYLSPGTYYIAGLIDTSGSAIESDTTNNTSSVITVTISNPDLAMGAVSVPSSGVVGNSISVSDSVTNVGSVDVNSGFNVDYYISTDSTVTSADTYMGYRYVSGLASGATDSNTGNITIPSNLANGDYYIAAIADPYDYLNDSDTTNNTSTPQLITISGGCSPDSYEEDDAYTSSTAIGVGQSQNHNFCTDADDWLAFSATSGTSYTITTSNLGNNADTILYLVDTDGVTQLSSNDDYSGYASQITWTASGTGTYYIHVYNYGGYTGNQKDYTVSLSTP